MPHPHTLHVAIEAECYCCGALQRFTFTSPNDQVVCAACVHHLGAAKAEKRDRDHVRIWSTRLAASEAALGELTDLTTAAAATAEITVVGLRATVTELTRLVAGDFRASSEGPAANGGAVRSYLQNELVQRAERNTDLANRRTDRMTAVLWQIEQLHRSMPAPASGLRTAPLCTCGRNTARCPEWAAIEPQRVAILDWATKNAALRAAGKRHSLPDPA